MILGVSLATIGVILLIVSVFAFLDPVGTKMADDTDPFGTPPSRLASFLTGLLSLGAASIGLTLIFRKNPKRAEMGPQN